VDAATLKLRVSPGARRPGLGGRHGDAWKVRVSAPPEDGRANDAVLALLSDALGLPRAAVEIVSGHASRDKTVMLRGLAQADAEARLTAAREKS